MGVAYPPDGILATNPQKCQSSSWWWLFSWVGEQSKVIHIWVKCVYSCSYISLGMQSYRQIMIGLFNPILNAGLILRFHEPQTILRFCPPYNQQFFSEHMLSRKEAGSFPFPTIFQGLQLLVLGKCRYLRSTWIVGLCFSKPRNIFWASKSNWIECPQSFGVKFQNHRSHQPPPNFRNDLPTLNYWKRS